MARATSTYEHLVRTDVGGVCARSVRRIAEHSWSEENLRAVVETPPKPKSTTLSIPPAADPLAPPPAVAEVHEEEEEEEDPTEKRAEDEEMQGEPPDTTMTAGASSSSRGEKRTETQDGIAEKRRLTTKSSTKQRTATFADADEPVKRRLTGKTHTKNDGVLMPVGIEVSYLLNTVNTLLSDECGNESLE